MAAVFPLVRQRFLPVRIAIMGFVAMEITREEMPRDPRKRRRWIHRPMTVTADVKFRLRRPSPIRTDTEFPSTEVWRESFPSRSAGISARPYSNNGVRCHGNYTRRNTPRPAWTAPLNPSASDGECRCQISRLGSMGRKSMLSSCRGAVRTNALRGGTRARERAPTVLSTILGT